MVSIFNDTFRYMYWLNIRYRIFFRYRLNIGVRVSPAGGLGSHKPIIRVVGRKEDVTGGTNQSGGTISVYKENGPSLLYKENGPRPGLGSRCS